MDYATHTRRIIETLGEAATVTPVSGAAVDVVGVFNANFDPNSLAIANIDSMRLSFVAMTVDLPVRPKGSLNIPTRGTYNVVASEADDDDGTTTLVLTKNTGQPLP